jgi:hypothetical protein
MRASEVRVKRESHSELYFAHTPLSGAVFAGLGMVFGYIPFHVDADIFAKGVVGGLGALFVLFGTLGAFWRCQLHLDLVSRSYTRTRGFWPSPKTIRGSLDELNGVIMTLEWHRTKSSRGGRTERPCWKISLDFQGWDRPISVEALGDERKAYERFEHYAKTLRTWAVDRTGEQEKKRTWDTLDVSVTEAARHAQLRTLQQAVPTDASVPPPGSAIRVSGYEGSRTVLLPPLGFSGGLIVLVLFGGVFAGVGGLFMLAKVGLYTELTGHTVTVKESSAAAGWVISSLFMVVGLGIATLSIVGSYGREQIQETGGALVTSFLVFGHPLRVRRIQKTDVEEVDLRADITARRRRTRGVRIGNVRVGTAAPDRRPRQSEVFFRSDKTIVRVGRHLSDADKRWLLGAVAQMVGSAR